MNYETLYNTIQAYAEDYEVLFQTNIPVFVQQAEARIYNEVHLPALRKNITTSFTAGNSYLPLPADFLAAYSLAVTDSSGNQNYMLNKDVSYLREAYPNSTTTNMPRYYSLFGTQASPNSATSNTLTAFVAPTPDQSYSVELHYFYYPTTIIQGQALTLTVYAAGSSLANGTYQNMPLSYTYAGATSGAGITADIVVSGNVVTSATVTFGGHFYVAGDKLSPSLLNNVILNVGSVSNTTGTSWLGNTYDPVLFYGAMREAMLFMKQEQDLVTYYETQFQSALAQLKRLGTGLEMGDAYRDGMPKIKAES